MGGCKDSPPTAFKDVDSETISLLQDVQLLGSFLPFEEVSESETERAIISDTSLPS